MRPSHPYVAYTCFMNCYYVCPVNLTNKIYIHVWYMKCAYILNIKCLNSVYRNSFFERIELCEAHLVTLTSKVYIDQSLVGSSIRVNALTGTCTIIHVFKEKTI